MKVELKTFFERIHFASDDAESHYYRVIDVPTHKGKYVGYTNCGDPCLIIRTRNNDEISSIQRAGFKVEFNQSFEIGIDEDNMSETVCTTIVCTNNDPVIQEYFIDVCGVIIDNIASPFPSANEIRNAVEKLTSLFQKLSGVKRNSIIGLIGELYFIYVAKSPKEAVRSWYENFREPFDFLLNGDVVEIKTTSDNRRIHDFSLEQSNSDRRGILVSILIEEHENGLTFSKLITNVKKQIDDSPELIVKLEKNIYENIGEDIETALSTKFSEELAWSSIKIYDLSSIPTVREIDSGVVNVRIRSDLSYAREADIPALVSKNKEILQILPKKIINNKCINI